MRRDVEQMCSRFPYFIFIQCIFILCLIDDELEDVAVAPGQYAMPTKRQKAQRALLRWPDSGAVA
jgi:hypothetical protein